MTDQTTIEKTEGVPAAAPAAAAAAATPPAFDAASRTTLFKALTPDNLQFAERNGFYKADGSHMADPNVIFDSYRNADKMLGVSRLPEPDLSNDEALAKWPGWDKLGVATDPKAIKLTRPKMPDGVPYDEAGEERFRQRLVQGHVPAKYHQALFDAEIEHRMGEQTRVQGELAGEKTRIETTLRKEYGDAYDAKRTGALGALKYLADKSNVKWPQLADEMSTFMGNEAMVRTMMKVSELLGEDTIKGAGNDGFATGPAAAKLELERLKGDVEHRKAAGDKKHPGHKAAIEREERLNKIIYG